jgi:twitching motility two-component system response regulator PilG
MQSSIPAGEIIEDGPEDVAGESVNPFTVMVIDDSKTIRRTAEALLKKEGYTVITATDGFEALSMIADHQPNLIFMDIMSSKDGLFDRARGRVVGSDYYLTKPFTREELLNAIEQFANKTAVQDAS